MKMEKAAIIEIYFKLAIKQEINITRSEMVHRKNPTHKEQIYEIVEKVYCLVLQPLSFSNSGEILQNYLRILKRRHNVLKFELLENYEANLVQLETKFNFES